MKILFYDLETTGLSSEECGIVQLAAIMTELDEHNHLTILDEINIEMCPRTGKRIQSVALEVNGYEFSQLHSLQPDEDGFKQFLTFMRKHINRYNKFDKCILAGYNNINFDNAFLRKWFKDNRQQLFWQLFLVNVNRCFSVGDKIFYSLSTCINELETINDGKSCWNKS